MAASASLDSLPAHRRLVAHGERLRGTHTRREIDERPRRRARRVIVGPWSLEMPGGHGDP